MLLNTHSARFPNPQVSSAALRIFEFGQAEAAKRGLLLVDTKYEFGKVRGREGGR